MISSPTSAVCCALSAHLAQCQLLGRAQGKLCVSDNIPKETKKNELKKPIYSFVFGFYNSLIVKISIYWFVYFIFVLIVSLSNDLVFYHYIITLISSKRNKKNYFLKSWFIEVSFCSFNKLIVKISIYWFVNFIFVLIVSLFNHLVIYHYTNIIEKKQEKLFF